MNKKLLTGLGASVLLVSSLYAYNGHGENRNESCDSKRSHHKMMKKGSSHHNKQGIKKMFKKLDLTQEQRTQIKEIMKKSMKNKKTMSSAFTNNSFNKEAFIAMQKEKRNMKIENKAEKISKIYAILTDTQKAKLKVMMDKH